MDDELGVKINLDEELVTDFRTWLTEIGKLLLPIIVFTELWLTEEHEEKPTLRVGRINEIAKRLSTIELPQMLSLIQPEVYSLLLYDIQPQIRTQSIAIHGYLDLLQRGVYGPLNDLEAAQVNQTMQYATQLNTLTYESEPFRKLHQKRNSLKPHL